MITIEREYSALKALEYYDLKNNILAGEPAVSGEQSMDSITKIQRVFDVNESQARAISCSNTTQGFSLIQGYDFFFFFASIVLVNTANNVLVLLVLVRQRLFLALLVHI